MTLALGLTLLQRRLLLEFLYFRHLQHTHLPVLCPWRLWLFAPIRPLRVTTLEVALAFRLWPFSLNVRLPFGCVVCSPLARGRLACSLFGR